MGQPKLVFRSAGEHDLDVALESAKRLRLTAIAVRMSPDLRKSEREGKGNMLHAGDVLLERDVVTQKTAVAILGPADLLGSFTKHLERF